MVCAPYDPLFIRPQSSGWTLVRNVRDVTLGGVRYAAVTLERIVRCPEGLFALRNDAGSFVSVGTNEYALSTTRAMPVRVWKFGAEFVLEAPCGPHDTAKHGTFLALASQQLKFVQSEFHIDALRAASAVLALSNLRIK